MKSTVEQVLKGKANQAIYSIDADDLVLDAVRLMSQKNIGALLVISENKIVGMVSERDYSRKVILSKRSSTSTRVREIMIDEVLYVDPQDCVEDCMALMTEKRVRHFPVITDGKVVGIISQGDIVKAMLDEKEFVIDQLTRYITGAYTDDSAAQAF